MPLELAAAAVQKLRMKPTKSKAEVKTASSDYYLSFQIKINLAFHLGF